MCCSVSLVTTRGKHPISRPYILHCSQLAAVAKEVERDMRSGTRRKVQKKY
jgi:hypothetical protein